MKIMGILNVTPDSFYAGCRATEREAIEARVRQIVGEGGDTIDVGGYSTRPGADEVAPCEELERVLPAVEIARRIAPEVEVSVDTFRAEVVRAVVERFGRITVNDISAGEYDDEMVAAVAELGLPYVAMHHRGDHAGMHSATGYADVAAEVCDYLVKRAELLQQAGVQDIILDPGFGFSKTVRENYELLGGMHRICELGYPVLAGISRKSMIYKVLECSPAEALAGTTALHWECLKQGATILRVHDVRQAREVAQLYSYYTER